MEQVLEVTEGNLDRPSMFQNIDLATTDHKPVILPTRVRIMSLHHIDTVNQQFEMRMEVDLRLPIHRYPGLLLLNRVDMSPTSWDPRLECMNLLDARQWSVRYSWIRRSSKTYLRYRYLIDGVFAETLELRWFPFDRQRMSTRIHLKRSDAIAAPFGYLPYRSVSKNRRDSIHHTFHVCNFSENNVWNLTYKFTKGVHKAEFSPDCLWVVPFDHSSIHLMTMSSIQVFVVLQRKPMYYIWNICLPMALLTLMSSAGVSIPVCDVSDRLGVQLTLVLTAVAYKFIASQDIPNVAYLTLLDFHVLVCFLSLFANVVESIVLASLVCEVPWKSSTNFSDTAINAASVSFTFTNIAMFLAFNLICLAMICCKLHCSNMNRCSRLGCFVTKCNRQVAGSTMEKFGHLCPNLSEKVIVHSGHHL